MLALFLLDLPCATLETQLVLVLYSASFEFIMITFLPLRVELNCVLLVADETTGGTVALLGA